MAKAKIVQKKSKKTQTSFLKKFQNQLERFFRKLAGKELAIWITIWFVLMSLLMLFANNLNIWQGNEWIEIHAAADIIASDAMPWIWE